MDTIHCMDLDSGLLGYYVLVHGVAMTGYVLFLVFWAVFALGYYLRDPSQDAEKTRQCDLW